MTRLAVAAAPGFACSDMELRRPGPTYTLDTLAALRAQGGPALWFILGADAVLDLPNWRAPERLVELARLAVVARPGATVDPASLDAILPGLAARVDWLALAADPLSATALRHRIAAGEAVGVDAAARRRGVRPPARALRRAGRLRRARRGECGGPWRGPSRLPEPRRGRYPREASRNSAPRGWSSAS